MQVRRLALKLADMQAKKRKTTEDKVAIKRHTADLLECTGQLVNNPGQSTVSLCMEGDVMATFIYKQRVACVLAPVFVGVAYMASQYRIIGLLSLIPQISLDDAQLKGAGTVAEAVAASSRTGPIAEAHVQKAQDSIASIPSWRKFNAAIDTLGWVVNALQCLRGSCSALSPRRSRADSALRKYFSTRGRNGSVMKPPRR